MKEQKLNEYISRCKREGIEAFRARREAIQELWSLYQNQQDYSKKESWQSQIFIPKIYSTVNQAAAVVKRALISTDKLFSLEPLNPDDVEVVARKTEFEQILRSALKASNFIDVFAVVIKAAFLTGMGVVKIRWENGLRFENVDILKLAISPTFQPLEDPHPHYVIEEVQTDLTVLKPLMKQANAETGKRIYKLSVLKDIEEEQTKEQELAKERARRGLSYYRPATKKVILDTFWGDIIDDETGKVIPNQFIQRLNEKYIVRWQDNPNKHGKPPYIYVIPLVYPHRGIIGESLVESLARMQYAFNNIANLCIDNLNFTVNKIFEIQPTNVINPEEIRKIYPGAVIFKHTPNKAIETVSTGIVDQGAIQLLNLLNVEMEKASAVTEYIMGYSGKNKTATEAELKLAQGQNLFDVIARDIEANSLSKLLEMSFSLLCQHHEIPARFDGRYRFKVGGISLLLSERNEREKIRETIIMANQMPVFGKYIQMKALVEKWLALNNLLDVYQETPDQPPQGQQLDILQKQAQEDARRTVSQLMPTPAEGQPEVVSPEQVLPQY